MSYKEIHVNVPLVETPRKRRHLTSIGWIAVIIAVLLVVSIGLNVARYVRDKTMTLADLPRVTVVIPTRAPRTPMPGPTATPEDWALMRDPITGEEYLSPPPADEAAIREAFEAALGCLYVTDMPDDKMLAQYQQEVQAKANQLVLERAIGPWGGANCARWSLGVAPWGPENPVRCKDYDTCTLGRAKIGPITRMILYDNEMAQQANLEAPCWVPVGKDEAPFRLYLADIQRLETGWVVVRLWWETLPEPPTEPPQYN